MNTLKQRIKAISLTVMAVTLLAIPTVLSSYVEPLEGPAIIWVV